MQSRNTHVILVAFLGIKINIFSIFVLVDYTMLEQLDDIDEEKDAAIMA